MLADEDIIEIQKMAQWLEAQGFDSMTESRVL